MTDAQSIKKNMEPDTKLHTRPQLAAVCVSHNASLSLFVIGHETKRSHKTELHEYGMIIVALLSKRLLVFIIALLEDRQRESGAQTLL